MFNIVWLLLILLLVVVVMHIGPWWWRRSIGRGALVLIRGNRRKGSRCTRLPYVSSFQAGCFFMLFCPELDHYLLCTCNCV